MEKLRHLDGTGKGEMLYDYKHDILTFRIKGRDYKRSVELQNFVIDIDTENFITGIRIFDASKISGLSKLLFKSIVNGRFEASVKDNVAFVRLSFTGKIRNKIILAKENNFTQQVTIPLAPKQHIEDSTVTARIAVS